MTQSTPTILREAAIPSPRRRKPGGTVPSKWDPIVEHCLANPGKSFLIEEGLTKQRTPSSKRAKEKGVTLKCAFDETTGTWSVYAFKGPLGATAPEPEAPTEDTL